MSTQSNRTVSDRFFSEPVHSAMSRADFDVWASQVRQQMVASLKKRATIDEDLSGNLEAQDCVTELEIDGEE